MIQDDPSVGWLLYEKTSDYGYSNESITASHWLDTILGTHKVLIEAFSDFYESVIYRTEDILLGRVVPQSLIKREYSIAKKYETSIQQEKS